MVTASPPVLPLIDRYGRPLTNLRVMVTGKCNFKCFFCHMEGYTESAGVQEITVEEMGLVAEALTKIGVSSFKITGGEPTLRTDLVDLIAAIRRHNPRAYISMTTNASLLKRHLQGLVEQRIGHINVSMHSLREEVFYRITGTRLYSNVIESVLAAHDYGIPLKINVVVLRGLNDVEIEGFVEFAARVNAKLQFIELHPVGKAKTISFDKYHIPWFEVLDKLKKRITKVRYRYSLHNRPILMLDNGVEVELVGPVGNPVFCSACTRVRLSYDLKLIPCLNWRREPIDVRGRIEGFKAREDKLEAIIKAFKEVVSLREPFYMAGLGQENAYVKRPWKTARLGLPKRGGGLSFTEPRALHHLLKYLEEWGYEPS
ncbi:MAG: GTP 3',8-cyclase MoaA [Pyrodictiaceae archaeon]